MFYVELDCIIQGNDANTLEELFMATLTHNVSLSVTATNNCNGTEEIKVVSSSKDNLISFIQWYNCDNRDQAESVFSDYGGEL